MASLSQINEFQITNFFTLISNNKIHENSDDFFMGSPKKHILNLSYCF